MRPTPARGALLLRGGLTLACWLAREQLALGAEPSFPRGPGFYYDPAKLILLLAIYFGWLAACGWVERDVTALAIDSPLPRAVMAGSGFTGLVILWLAPAFWLGFLLFAMLFGMTTALYVHHRNQKVSPARRVLTESHIRVLLARYLGYEPARPVQEEYTSRHPVRFLGRTDERKRDKREKADGERVKAVEESEGYKAALEMVNEAIEKRATDIHLEPTKAEMAVRLRIDGILTATKPFSRQMGDAVINIIKVVCNMDITERRKPQDGSFSAQVRDRTVDFRVATAGSVIGEKLVMRILDRSQQIIDLTQLGMRAKMRGRIQEVVSKPHGMLIVCGPTGAGKSTTLYACLNEIDRFQKNVITIENPVEYHVDNVTQIEVNLKAGKTFASELRSILRQDPDIIMIGEIRDQETATIACQAAQTGHLVFSTLHANDTVTAIGRLIDLGVQPFMVASALSAVLGQRLVRRLCSNCKVRYTPGADFLRKANLPVDKVQFLYRPARGQVDEGEEDDGADDEEMCATCGGAGFFKRTGIYELLVITDKIRDLIRANPNLTAIREEAVKEGMRYLHEDGLRKVLDGDTTIQELLRVSK